MKPIPPIDLDELDQSIQRNRRERLDYIRFKVQWMREHGQIVPPKS